MKKQERNESWQEGSQNCFKLSTCHFQGLLCAILNGFILFQLSDISHGNYASVHITGKLHVPQGNFSIVRHCMPLVFS